MEDKQIIELYWERSDEAIKETKEKYGQHCCYIANNILQNEGEVEHCLKEIYERVWDTIPPRRPQNFKAYLCKITRNHALHRRYPELDGQVTDLFTAELIIHDFLKELEPKQRKLFVAHYWYFASVSEIASQNKMSENKVNETLVSLRQKLDVVLEKKGIQLQTEAEFFYAMTEMDDRYWEEAEPQMSVAPNAASEENGEKGKQKLVFTKSWKKYVIPATICTILCVLVIVLFPKKPTQENPYESGSEDDYFNSGTGILGTENKDEDWYGGEYLKEEDFQDRMNALPWGEGMKIGALPIFKNLAFYSEAGETVYFEENSLLERADKIAKQLNMQVIHVGYTRTDTGKAFMIEMETDKGEIRIQGNGNVYITFSDGVQIPKEYQMSTIASKEKANESVLYLLDYYKNIFDDTDWSAVSYTSYNSAGIPKTNYRAVGTAGYGVENILAHYFNYVDFSYSNQDGLTGISYSDLRQVSELVDYYPIISVEEAKLLLKEGKYIFDFMELGEWEYDESLIQGVELMYRCSPMEKYFQPYYCFYLKKEDSNNYHAFYVPAIKGGNIEDMLPPEKEVTILDMGHGSHQEEFVYYRDEQFYTIKGFEKVEVKTSEFDSKLTYKEKVYDIHFSWCEVDDEIFVYLKNDNTDGEISIEKIPNCTDKVLLYKIFRQAGIDAVFLCDLKQQKITFLLDAETVNAEIINSVSVSSNIDAIIVNTQKNTKPLLYNGSEIIDLSEVIGEINLDMNSALTATCVEDKVLILHSIFKPGDTYRTAYVYDIATKSVECTIQDAKMYLDEGRYTTREVKGEIEIVDIISGVCKKTGLLESEVKKIFSANENLYAFVLNSREIVLIEKESGQIFKVFSGNINVTLNANNIQFKDNMLYVEEWSGRYLVYVLTD